MTNLRRVCAEVVMIGGATIVPCMSAGPPIVTENCATQRLTVNADVVAKVPD
jgi:hypothetical protein